MYSKNDYRYYLEHQLMHSDDFLAHYGVKGMKWGKLKSKLTYNGETGVWTHLNGIGSTTGKAITWGSSNMPKTGETAISATYVNINKKPKKLAKYTKIGRALLLDTGNTKTVSIDTTTKKKRKKAARRNTVRTLKTGATATRIVGDYGVVNGLSKTAERYSDGAINSTWKSRRT